MTSTQQRAELQRQIWQIANDVRGAVDGWDFKQYVLGTLFYRFISENFAGCMEADDESIDHLARSVPYETIAANDYNLSVSTYVEAEDTREVIDITNLNAELKTTVGKIELLLADIDAVAAAIEGGVV